MGLPVLGLEGCPSMHCGCNFSESFEKSNRCNVPLGSTMSVILPAAIMNVSVSQRSGSDLTQERSLRLQLTEN